MPLSRFSSEFFDNTSFDKKERLSQVAETKKANLAQVSGPDPFELPVIDSLIDQNFIRESAYRDRSGGELTGDALLGMSKFVADVGFNLAATVSPVGSREILDAGQSTNQWLTDFTSDISQLSNQRLAQDQARAQAGNQRRYEEEDGGEGLWGAFKREYRNLGDTLGNYWDNPTAAFDTITSQLPTLGVGRAASIASRAHRLRRIDRASRGLAPVGGATKDQLFNRYLGAGVAAMEAPGVYAENYRDIIEAPLEELIERFPDQAEALKNDIDGSVRESLANRSAYAGTALQAPSAYFASRLGAAFQRDPLGITRQAGASGVRQRGVQGLADSLRDIGGEVLEESTQALTGSLAGAAGRAMTGEENVDFLEGVGEGVGEGIVGAAGLSGTLRAPSTAVAAARAAVIAPLARRVERIKESNERAVQEGVKQEAVETANRAADLAQINESLPEEVKFVPESTVAEFESVPEETPEEVPTKSADRLMALSQVLTSFPTQEDEATKVNMGFFAARTARELRSHLNSVVEPTLAQATDDASREQLQNYKEQISRLLDSDQVRQIEEAVATSPEEVINEVFASIPEADAVREGLEADGVAVDPQVAQAIEQVVDLAHKAPERVTREVAQRVLAHSRRMGNPDSPKWKAVQAAEKLAAATENYAERKTRIDAIDPGRKTTDIVRDEIKEKGFQFRGKKLMSVAQHFASVADAMGKGDVKTAQDHMKDFGRFVSHMRNKARAFDNVAYEQYQKGTPDVKFPVEYKTTKINGDTGPLKAYVNIAFKGGEQLVDSVISDSDMVADAWNTLVQTYPELGISRTLVPLGQPRWRSAAAAQSSSQNTENANASTAADNVVAESTRAVAEESVPARSQNLNDWSIEEIESELAKEKHPKARKKLTKHLQKRLGEESRKVEEESVVFEELTEEKTIAPRRRQQIEDLPQSVREWSDEQLSRELAYANIRNETSPSDITKSRIDKIQKELDQREAAQEARSRPEHKTVKDRFPSVLESTGEGEGIDSQNIFLKAFRPSKKSNSVFARFANPMQAMRDALKKGDFNSLLTPDNRFIKFDERETQQLDRVVNKLVPALIERMNQNIKGSTRTIDKNGWKYHNHFSLHFTDGQGNLDPRVAEAASLAAFQWAMEQINIPPKHDEDRLDKWFPDGIPENFQALFAEYHNFETSVSPLASRIVQMMGLSHVPDMPNNWAEGLSKALALEAIGAMRDLGIVETAAEKMPVRSGQKMSFETLNFIRFNKDANKRGSLQEIRDNLSAIKTARLLTPDSTTMPYFKPIRQVPNRQNNSVIHLSDKHKEIINKQNRARFWHNTPLVNFRSKLGRHNMEFLKGHNTEVDGLNVIHARSVRGTNLGIESTEQLTDEMVEMWRLQAEATGQSVEDIPAYVPNVMDSNTRIRQEGHYTPQNNKAAREIMASTRVVMNLDTSPDDIIWFHVSLAQAMGIKTEVKNRNTYTQELVDQLDTPYVRELVDAINELDASETPNAELVTEVTNRFDSLMNGEIEGSIKLPRTDRAIHAMHTWARYQKAMAENTHYKFTTYLPIELDGKTDGPINAFIHMAVHKLDEYMIKQLAQGGIFINTNEEMTLNKANEQDGEFGDIYLDVASRFQESIRGERLSDDTFAAAVRLMGLAKQAVYDDPSDLSSVQVVRNVAKTAVTPKSYAAGARSVSNKLAGEQIDGIYAYMSELLANDDTMPQHYAEAISQLSGVPVSRLLQPDQYRNFKFTDRQVKEFRNSIHSTIGESLNGAVDAEMQHVQKTFSTLYTASIIQSAAFASEYHKAYKAKHKELVDAGELRPTDALSRKQEQEIVDSLAHIAPNIATTFSDSSNPLEGVSALVGSRSGTMTRTHKGGSSPVYVQALKGGFQLPISLNDFQSPSVRIAALLNISVGDAAMILGILDRYSNGFLQVYDGFEVPPKNVQNIAEFVNKVVHDNYKFDTLGEAKKTFDRFDDKAIDKMSDDEIYQLAIDLHLPDGGPQNVRKLPARAYRNKLKKMVNSLRQELDEAAKANKAAKDVVLEKFASSTDHMATGEKSHVTADLPVAEDIVAEVNKAVVAVIPSSKPSQGTLRTFSGTQFKEILDKAKFKDKVTGSVYKAIRHLIPDDAVIYRGSKEEMAELFSKNHRGVHLDPQANGWRYGNELYLTTNNQEVVVHELIHLTTQGLIDNFIIGKVKGMTSAQKKALQNLKMLAEEFSQMDLGQDGAAAHSQSVVKERIQSGHINEAIGEFMAYVMTNPETRAALKQQNPSTRIGQMAKTALNAVRRILGLPKNQFTESFLTQAMGEFHRVVRRPLSDAHTYRGGNALFHTSPNNYIDPKIEQISSSVDRVLAYIPRNGDTAFDRVAMRKAAQIKATTASLEFDEQFDFSPDQQVLFIKVQAVLSSGLPLDAGVMTALSDIHAEALKQLKVEDFLDTPGSTNPQDTAKAEARFNTLTADDKNGLANFVALSMVNPEFRAKLSTLSLPKAEKLANGSDLDTLIRNSTTKVFDSLYSRSMGVRPSQSQQDAIDTLMIRLGQANDRLIQQQRKAGSSPVDQAEAFVRKQAEKLDSKLLSKSKSMMGRSAGHDIAGFTLNTLRAFVTDKGAAEAARKVTGLINQTDRFKGLRSLVSEIIGTMDESWPMHQLLNRSKELVATARQRLRDEAPAQIHAYFSKPLNKTQTKILHKAVGRSDLQALYGAVGFDQLRKYVTSSTSRRAAIASLEKQLGAVNGEYTKNAKDLAELMVLGEVTKGEGKLLYTNADAIAYQLGNPTQPTTKQAKESVDLIDQLTSLYALDLLDPVEQKTLADLMTNESSGMESTLTLMSYLVRTEKQKDGADAQRFNAMKGYIPSSRDPRYGLITGKASEVAKHRELGYEPAGPALMDPMDPSTQLQHYVARGHAGQASYNQGAMQTVESTMNGVNMLTGEMISPMGGSVIYHRGTVNSISRGKLGRASHHRLRPLFDEKGEIRAYERLYSPKVLEQHTRGKEDITQAIGMWLGRQEEETIAREVNREVIKLMKKDWDSASSDEKTEFTDISNPKDSVSREQWNAIPQETRQELIELFGDGGVMVRRNMVDNTIGYRSPSVSDVFTEVSNLPKPVREAVKNAALATLGPNAYRWLVLSERGMQSAVSLAKNVIIVRSGVVAVANALSNVLQLMAEGIPLTQIPKILAKKKAETETYLRIGKRVAQLKLDAASDQNSASKKKKQAEIDRLESQLKKLSIWPLLENGELPSIVEGLSESDEYTILNDVSTWLKKKSDALPGGLNTAARYAVISKDTALYQGLNRMIQFGDFTAKAAVYDRQIALGRTKDQALKYVSETFVNYNLLPGRSRTYLEGIGLTWFMNYKLRMQKIILRTMRNNPIRFLGSVTTGGFTGVDSLLDVAAPQANWSYATGYDQLFKAREMPLWNQMVR